MLIHALVLALTVAGEPGSPQGTPIEVYDGVKVTAQQIQDAKSKAVQAYSGEIERIYVGQLVHPFPNREFTSTSRVKSSERT